MKGRKTVGFLTAAAILAVATLVVVLLDSPATHPADSGRGQVLRSRIPLAKGQAKTATRIQVSPRVEAEPEAKKIQTDAESAQRLADDQEEKLLDQVTKELLVALDEAVKRGDLKMIIALADKLRAMNYGASSGGGGFSSVKRKILEALADAGISGLGPVIDLLGDQDSLIAQSATDILFKSLRSAGVNDYQRADIVTAAAEEVTDPQTMVRLFNEFMRMRHSVGVAAFKQIETSGTDAAKAQLARAISAFTGNSEISAVNQLDEWIAAYPDSAMDPWYYGNEPYESVRNAGMTEGQTPEVK